mmetsp:Transcript_87767/g.248723  ORF Transcript_87767/g.248723 Transcript_87767/m.248723 type:complete len:245 (-) Transcript_87767:193-927(-)
MVKEISGSMKRSMSGRAPSTLMPFCDTLTFRILPLFALRPVASSVAPSGPSELALRSRDCTKRFGASASLKRFVPTGPNLLELRLSSSSFVGGAIESPRKASTSQIGDTPSSLREHPANASDLMDLLFRRPSANPPRRPLGPQSFPLRTRLSRAGQLARRGPRRLKPSGPMPALCSTSLFSTSLLARPRHTWRMPSSPTAWSERSTSSRQDSPPSSMCLRRDWINDESVCLVDARAASCSCSSV